MLIRENILIQENYLIHTILVQYQFVDYLS